MLASRSGKPVRPLAQSSWLGICRADHFTFENIIWKTGILNLLMTWFGGQQARPMFQISTNASSEAANVSSPSDRRAPLARIAACQTSRSDNVPQFR